jgi:uncharacterized membrane protein
VDATFHFVPISDDRRDESTMDVTLWIIQGLLAVAFLGAGTMKAVKPMEQLLARMPWTEDVSPATVRLIGVAELIGAIGLIVPSATDLAVWLTPLAATGLATIMALAARTHARRKEPQAIVVNAVLFALAAVVAWGRFGPYAF